MNKVSYRNQIGLQHSGHQGRGRGRP